MLESMNTFAKLSLQEKVLGHAMLYDKPRAPLKYKLDGHDTKRASFLTEPEELEGLTVLFRLFPQRVVTNLVKTLDTIHADNYSSELRVKQYSQAGKNLLTELNNLAFGMITSSDEEAAKITTLCEEITKPKDTDRYNKEYLNHIASDQEKYVFLHQTKKAHVHNIMRIGLENENTLQQNATLQEHDAIKATTTLEQKAQEDDAAIIITFPATNTKVESKIAIKNLRYEHPSIKKTYIKPQFITGWIDPKTKAYQANPYEQGIRKYIEW